MTIGGVGNHQCLHGHGILFHEIRDAGIGINDYFVGQSHLATAIALFGIHELLAKGPVVVAQGHADR